MGYVTNVAVVGDRFLLRSDCLQVIYSMTPLCTAFFAYLILGGEATGPVAWAGGSLIILAALMAADAQQKQHRQQQQEQ